MHGYYQLELVSILRLRQAGATQDEILNRLYERWAAHDANAAYRLACPPIRRPVLAEPSPSWDDYEYGSQDAHEALAYELKGGSGIGHTEDTIPQEKANELASRFFALFHAPRAYRGMGLGDPFYAFEQGVVLLDAQYAGCFLIIESD